MHNHFDQHLHTRKLIEDHQPWLVVEAGCGDSTKQLIELQKQMGFRLVLMDVMDDPNRPGSQGFPPGQFVPSQYERVEFLYGVSYVNFELFADNSIDVAIVDTDHNGWTLAKELSALERKVRNGGLILLHDTETFKDENGVMGRYPSGDAKYPMEEILAGPTMGQVVEEYEKKWPVVAKTIESCGAMAFRVDKGEEGGWNLRTAATKALSGATVFDPNLANVPGFASREMRFLISELCLQVTYPRYLEVGVFYGATFGAAMQRKEGRFVGIDNFTDFQGAVLGQLKGTDLDRLEVHAPHQRHSIQAVMAAVGQGQALFYEQDCLSVAPELVKEKLGGGINVYFYDGDHSAKATMDGILHFAPAFADQLILVVDDYSHAEVEVGTRQALDQLPFTKVDEVLFQRRQSEPDDFNYVVYTCVLQRKESV